MLRKIGFAGLFLVLLATTAVPALAQADTEVAQWKETLTYTDVNPCNLNLGDIYFEGTFHGLAIVTYDANGKLHLRVQENSQRAVATNLDTGVQYQAVLTSHIVEQGEILDDRHSEMWIEQYRLVAPGPDGEDILLRLNLHVVSDANGEIRAWVEGGAFQCPD